ncbi:MAG: hypothetical protein ACFCUS_01470 [Rubrimonas sp.]|uniref:hypothetical protein n=1 Tax=Rubrimonas sp. TaxID=2036015 RepID=UPI002FDCEEAD
MFGGVSLPGESAAQAAPPVVSVAVPEPSPADLLFATPHLANLAVGDSVRYAHIRRSPEGLGVGPDLSEPATLEKRAERASTVTIGAASHARTLEFEQLSGNPMLMVFLESALRSVGDATGGGGYYLRNRIRESLRDRIAAENGALVARPFAGLPEAERLGGFAGLTLTFVLSDDAPGMVETLRAEATGAGYLEEFTRDAR